MAHIANTDTNVAVRTSPAPRHFAGARGQAFFILYAGFVALPIIAGLDKFFNLLVSWEQYLSPLATDLIPISASTFMMIVGVIEIAAGLLVAIHPRIGACVVAMWLVGIIVNLLTMAGFYDIALRDFGLALGALALARLAGNSLFGRSK
jgi:hypothetical protein